MKKILLGIVLILTMLGITSSVMADLVPKSSEFFSGGELIKSKSELLRDYTGGGEEGAEQFRSIADTVIKFLKKALVPIAIVLIAYAGIELFVSRGKEEEFTKKKHQILGIAVGFGLMLLAVNLVDFVFFGQEGEILREGTDITKFALRGVSEMRGIYQYLTSFVVVVAVAYLVITAFTMILAGGENEAEITNAKKRIVYTLAGIAIIISIEPIVQIFTRGGQITMPSVNLTINFMMRWANFILSLLGIGAVVALIWAGLRLILHYGDEQATEEAKRIAKAAVIGLILAFSAWTIVNFFAVPGG